MTTMKNRSSVVAVAGVCALLLLGWPMRGYSQTQKPNGRVRFIPKTTSTSQASSGSSTSAPFCVDANITLSTCLFNYYGGPVISNIDAVVVYWGTSVSNVVDCGGGLDSHGNCIGISQFHSAVGNSTFIDMLGEYNTAGVDASAGSKLGLPGNQNIGRGTLHPGSPFIITPSASNSGPKINDANIQSELQSQIAAGHLPAVATDGIGNVNTIYVVYFPPGLIIDDGTGSLSCTAGGFCAYHSTYFNLSGLAVPYGVVPDFGPGSGCDTGCGSGTQWQNITSTVSHELAESITDAAVGLPSTSTLVFDYPLTWYDVNNGEIGDPCAPFSAAGMTFGGTDSLQFGATTFVVQQLFSQKAYKANPTAACVSPGTPTFTLTAPANSTPGSPFDVTVTANNGDGSTYLGTVQFTSSDGSARLPADYTFAATDAGAHTFSGAVTLNMIGTDNLSVADVFQASNAGSAAINVLGSAPLVTANPSDTTVIAGSTATFTAAATGTPAPTVQWQVSTNGGTTFTDIAGQTSTTLSLSSVVLGQNGQKFRAVFTNSLGTATTTAATLTVNSPPPTCATDVSGTVTVKRSGYSYNFITKRFVQTITLKNNSASPIAGPISLAIDGLTANATLFNSAGTTTCAVPLGSPYVSTTGPPAPGSSTSVVLQFTDPTRTGFNYSTRVLAGAQP